MISPPPVREIVSTVAGARYTYRKVSDVCVWMEERERRGGGREGGRDKGGREGGREYIV